MPPLKMRTYIFSACEGAVTGENIQNINIRICKNIQLKNLGLRNHKISLQNS